MGVAGGRPQALKAQQLGVDQGHTRRGVRHRRDPANRKAGGGLHKIGVGAAQLLALATDQRLDLFFVHPTVARGHHQHRRAIGLAPKNNALGDLAQRHTQRVGRLLGGAGRVVQHQRRVWVAPLGQPGAHALHTFGQGHRNHEGDRFTINRLAPMAISTPPNTRFCARRARAVANQRWARDARKA